MFEYISIFLLTVMGSVILFFVCASMFGSVADYGESAVYTIGSVIIILLSFLITQMFYVIGLMKGKVKK
ncbi:hypothetical protein [Fredinandcohnia quinoae]|uniref:NADH dehydrogenase subunit 6 n=1 Tax=Fredinandcohnia quinoae TaxID=2918902 RepID=A0AAW5E5C5_9BACI|nr:hypothetical protein [Fredinandcohnia sp. SECRCQ15]MCH1626450.1 hypothetical protein [Fredinandcohnia sp. SECRCQ15]